jgi:hypothetical protein
MEALQEYRSRKARCEQELARLSRRSRTLSLLRMVVFLAGLILLAVLVSTDNSVLWLGLPAGLFLVLAVIHQRVDRRLEARRQALRHYERGIARIEDRWRGTGPTGERYSSQDHPYADHLDLFGEGSLFQLLCSAKTQPGQDTLASWLLHPAPLTEHPPRWTAVEELRPQLEHREVMDRLCQTIGPGVDPARLRAWAAHRVEAPRARARWGMLLASAATVISLVAWLGFRGPPLLFLFFLGLGWFAEQRLQARLEPLWEALEGVVGQLDSLARILLAVERSQFESVRLAALRATLFAAGTPPPSMRILQLRRRLEWLDSARNLLFAPLAFLLLWRSHFGLAIQAWMARNGVLVDDWLQVVGEYEALLAFSAYAFENSEDRWPELSEEACLEATSLGHPLLPRRQCVRNDIRLDEGLRLYVISGSNMSGKSTLLRTVGLNVVLALAGAPVRAQRFRLGALRLGASLRIVDSLPQGISHFYAEVKRLRELQELCSAEPSPEESAAALLLLDEIFHGTNSHDRRRGAAAVLRRFVRRGAFVLVTTHDLALAEVAVELGPVARNVHFEDQIREAKMVFNYKMRPGVAGKGNALRILAAEGLLEDTETGGATQA